MLLKKQPVQLKVKSSAKNFIPVVGLVAGSSKTLYYLAGTASEFKIDSSDSYVFIIKENSNSTNPIDIIQVGKFHVTSKNREYTFRNTSINVAEVKNSEGDELLEFESEKHGETSYKITLKNLAKGQYFISMTTVNDFYSFEIK